MLLDMCKSNSMLILNGRRGDDKFTCSMTFESNLLLIIQLCYFNHYNL